MKKLLLLLLTLLPLISVASVDESKTDVYFSNGVDTEDWEAWRSVNKVLRPAIEKEIYNNDITKRDQEIGKFDLLYNNTNGLILDFIEATAQKINTTSAIDPNSRPPLAYWVAIGVAFLAESVAYITSSSDINEHVSQVSDSVTSGHKVLVVAHSQGNFFTSIMLEKMDDWMSQYIYTVRVASPENRIDDSVYRKGDRFSWDDDLVGLIGGGTGQVVNPIRWVSWEDIDENNTEQEEPIGNYVEQPQVNAVLGGKYRAVESFFGIDKEYSVHSLTFYMGGVLTLPIEGEIDKREIVINPFTNQPLSTNVGRGAIIG